MDWMKSVLLLVGLWVATEATNSCQSNRDCPSTYCCVKLVKPYASRTPIPLCRPRRVYEPNGQCMPDTGCRTASDCPRDYCCIARNRPRGRRRRETAPADGTCTKLTGLDGSCLVSSSVLPSSGQQFICPCQDGLTCEGTGLFDIPLGEMGVCRNSEPSPPQQCSTGADCPAGFCCRVQPQVKGRKRRQVQTGECTALTPSGGTCYFSLNISPSPGQHFRCPCQGGLTCASTGVTEVPVGVLGVCN